MKWFLAGLLFLVASAGVQGGTLTNMVFVEGGTFTMGQLEKGKQQDAMPRVTLHSFEIADCEVTQGEMARVLSWAYEKGYVVVEDGSVLTTERGEEVLLKLGNISWDGQVFSSVNPNHPCQNVSWYGAALYCNYQSEIAGLERCYNVHPGRQWWECDFSANGYRLPTEAEWEYAARGGVRSQGFLYSGGSNLHEVGWYSENNGQITRITQYKEEEAPPGQDLEWLTRSDVVRPASVSDVGRKAPNELGLFDMSGNVAEWCNDWFGEYEEGELLNPIGAGPLLGSKNLEKVVRGGGYAHLAQGCRVVSRQKSFPEQLHCGFRVARTVSSGTTPPVRRRDNPSTDRQESSYTGVPAMIPVEGGSFLRDVSNESRDHEGQNMRRVTVSNFSISNVEVTSKQFNKVMSWAWEKYFNDLDRSEKSVSYKKWDLYFLFGQRVADKTLFASEPGKANYPFLATWYGAAFYCNALSEMEGLTPCYLFDDREVVCDFSANGYRLPTEAEWEFAARGGSAGRDTLYSGSDNLSDVGWYSLTVGEKKRLLRKPGVFFKENNLGIPSRLYKQESSFFSIGDVGQKLPNELGLFDMSGNASEWCNDWYGDYPDKELVDPLGVSLRESYKEEKVIRGGDYSSSEYDCRVMARSKGHAEDSTAGFRTVRGGERTP